MRIQKTLPLLAMMAGSLMSPGANADGTPAAHKLAPPAVNETLTIPRHQVDILDSHMSYLETGSGTPVLFLHGNPTSAYLWRNVIPHVSGSHRAIAPDLIGMGESGKPALDYTFNDHYRYLDAFVNKMGLEKFTIVGHDWGAALAWEFARRNPDKVTRLAFMEGVLPPTFPRPTFESMGEEMGNMFRAFKDEKKGVELVIDNNMFVEQVLPGFVSRPLGEKAMNVYRQPFLEAADRKPVLAWPREVPIEGKPVNGVATMQGIEKFMGETTMPVLLAYAEPGAIIPPQLVDWYRGKIKRLETAYIGQGLHFIQEDQPDAIGRALSDWIRRN